MRFSTIVAVLSAIAVSAAPVDRVAERSLQKRHFLCDGVDFEDPCPAGTKTIQPLDDYARNYLSAHPAGATSTPAHTPTSTPRVPVAAKAAITPPPGSGNTHPGTVQMACYPPSL